MKVDRTLVGWVLLGIVAVLAGLKIYTELELRRVRKTYPPVGRFVSVDGVRLHYVRQGQGHPVVMLHGRDGALQEFTFSVFGQVAERYDIEESMQ